MQSGTVNNKSLANLYLLVILSLTYTAAAYLPLFRFAMLFILLSFLLPLVLAKSFYTTKMFWWVLMYTIVVALKYVSGNMRFDTPMTVLYEVAYLFIPISMTYYVFSKNDLLLQKRSLVLFFLILLLTTIATTYFFIVYPSVIRNGHFYKYQYGEEFYAGMYKFGLSNFILPHALPCLMPAVIMGLRNRELTRIMKILLWVSFTLLIFIVYLSGSFACLGITFLGLVFSLIIKPGPMRNNYLRIMMLVLFSVIILNPSVRNSVIDYALLSIDSDNDYYKKIEEFKELDNVSDKSIVEGDVNVRRNFYYQSIEQGLDNIFFGSDGSKIGRHSAIFDRFGVLGLMGIVPYLLFIIASISFTIKYIKHDYLVYYYVGVIIAFIIFFTKALHGWEQWLSVFYILPVSINLLTPKSENQFIK